MFGKRCVIEGHDLTYTPRKEHVGPVTPICVHNTAISSCTHVRLVCSAFVDYDDVIIDIDRDFAYHDRNNHPDAVISVRHYKIWQRRMYAAENRIPTHEKSLVQMLLYC